MEYPSIEPKLPGWCAGGDDVVAGPIRFVAATKWNLLHRTLVGCSGCGTWCQLLSSDIRHGKQDVAWSDSEKLTDRPLPPRI